MTLGEPLAGRANALNFVRLILASAVILGHTYPLGGFESRWMEGLSGGAVTGFFAISGYLIAGSRVRLSAGHYLWNRALRIFPAFWVCLAFVAFVAAPISTLLDEQARFDGRSAVSFVSNNALLYIRQWGIEGTLTSTHYPVAWNGSLWTLFYEFMAYIAGGVVLSFAWTRRHAPVVLGALTAAAMIAYPLAVGPLEVTTNLFLNALRLGAFFVAGMWLWSVREHVPASGTLGLISAVAVAVLFFMPEPWRSSLGPLPMAYLMLYLGGALPTRVGSANDLSYGVYVYAFPVQQLLALAGGHAFGVAGMALVAWLLVLPLAWASWRLVEQPALRLKRASGWLAERRRARSAALP